MAILREGLVYLFDSIFQVESVAGKPCVGGHIEVYLAGTNTRYITYQSWDGTVNPFKIPLRNDGRAVILVSPVNHYDAYIYDSYGNMVCSRLNIVPGGVGGDVHLDGAAVTNIKNTDNTLDVILNSTSGTVNDYTINSNHKPLGVETPLKFVQDDEEATIIGLDENAITSAVAPIVGPIVNSAVATAISSISGQFVYSAGDYIDITNNVISVTGDVGKTYSAGDNIAITEDNVISGKDWTGEIASAVEPKLDTSAFSAVSGDFLTEVPESAVSGFATHEEVESATSGKADTSALSAKLDTSAVETWTTLDEQTTVTGINGYPISAKFGGSGFLPMSLSGMSASGNYFKTSDNSFFGVNTSGISANPKGGVTSVQIGGYNAPEISIGGYYGTMTFNSAGGEYRKADNSVAWKIGQADHLFVTNDNPDYQNVAIDISQAPRDMSSTRVLIGKNGLSACNIGTSSGINTTNAPATIVGNSQVKVDYGDMHSVLTIGDVYVQQNGNQASSTWHLTASVQKREIECDSATSAITAIAGSAIGGKEYSAGANIDITDEVISGKDWSDEIVAATSGLQPSGDYLSVSESANFYPMSGNPSGFLTEHQSLDGLMETSGLEYDGDKISGYMGSAFAGGGEVPDETVLWSGVATTGTLTATESVLNFDHYKVYISERERGTPAVLEFHTENTATSGNNAQTSNGGYKAIALTMFQTTNKEFFTINSNHAVWNDSFTELSLSTTGYNKYMPWNTSGFTQWDNANYTPAIRIHKIVGCNRKENA